ncbi:MAG: hypothetical protein ACLUHE_08595 [Christensenellales bacterium]
MKSDTRYSNRKPGVKTERPVRDMRTQRTQKEQKVQLTVRGMARGAIRMEAEDGTIYTCAKDNARGALSVTRCLLSASAATAWSLRKW